VRLGVEFGALETSHHWAPSLYQRRDPSGENSRNRGAISLCISNCGWAKPSPGSNTSVRASLPKGFRASLHFSPRRQPRLAGYGAQAGMTSNRCHRFRGFVYHHARSSPDSKRIEVSVRPRKGSAAICSRCHQPAPRLRPARRATLFSTEVPPLGILKKGMDEKFSQPGSDGELDASANIWRKGIVFTGRAGGQMLPGASQGYRVSVAFKRAVSAQHPFTGFHDVYHRVSFVANQRISQVKLPGSNEQPARVILYHGWRLLGDTGNIATAFITLGVRSPGESSADFEGEQPPTDGDLRTPGGTSIENLAHMAPQHVDEIYNEFDFSDPSFHRPDPITVSYGERILGGAPAGFEPFVERAEGFARSYHTLLKRFGEVKSPFRTVRREWFLADPRLVTIHICFSR
jgi:hypothetical protein